MSTPNSDDILRVLLPQVSAMNKAVQAALMRQRWFLIQIQTGTMPSAEEIKNAEASMSQVLEATRQLEEQLTMLGQQHGPKPPTGVM